MRRYQQQEGANSVNNSALRAKGRRPAHKNRIGKTRT